MAIRIRCPHCSESTVVADELNGAQGACAVCGKPLVVPAAKKGRSLVTCLAIVIAAPILIEFGAVLVGLLLPSVNAAREAARRAMCGNNLKQISMALLMHESTYKQFPLAAAAKKPGGPPHSWRVEILPFLDERALYSRYKFDEAWDSPNNRQLARQMPHVFRCPSSSSQPRDTETNYMMLIGPDTVGGLPGTAGVSARNLGSRASQTLLVVEVPGPAVNWMEPKDITVEELLQRMDAGGRGRLPHVRGFNVALCDGSVHFLSITIDREILRRLAKINSDKPVSLPE
jgi:hypothetical protein